MITWPLYHGFHQLFFFSLLPCAATPSSLSKKTTMIVVSSTAYRPIGGGTLNTPMNNALRVPPMAFLARQIAAFSSSIAKYSGVAFQSICAPVSVLYVRPESSTIGLPNCGVCS